MALSGLVSGLRVALQWPESVISIEHIFVQCFRVRLNSWLDEVIREAVDVGGQDSEVLLIVSEKISRQSIGDPQH